MTLPGGAQLTPSEKRTVQALLWALKPLANVRPPMPLPFVTALLMVALDEGNGVNAYARAAGIHRSMMSRNLHALGDHARNGGPGLKLLTIMPDAAGAIRTQVFLTAEGRVLVNEMLRGLRRAG